MTMLGTLEALSPLTDEHGNAPRRCGQRPDERAFLRVAGFAAHEAQQLAHFELASIGRTLQLCGAGWMTPVATPLAVLGRHALVLLR